MLERLFDRSPDVAFFVKDAVGRYVAVNESQDVLAEDGPRVGVVLFDAACRSGMQTLSFDHASNSLIRPLWSMSRRPLSGTPNLSRG